MDLSSYREYFSEQAYQVLTLALEESRRRRHGWLGVEHLFLALVRVEGTLFREVMQELGVDPDAVLRSFNERLSMATPPADLGGATRVSASTKVTFKIAWEEARRHGRRVIEPTDLFAAVFQKEDALPVRVLRSMGVDLDAFLQLVSLKVRQRQELEEELRRKYELPPHLKYFGVNLNRLARLGRIPPIVGREREMDRLIEILCHREGPNSAMLIGEAGVGKTAIVEGLAARLELQPETVPERLRGCQIVNLQMSSVVAGTVFRGMFEDRMEKIVNELKERRNLILFVDEAHTIIGAGSALGVNTDAANILKSSLSRGEIQIIGATTASEYKQFIQEDEALARRFRVIYVDEPTLEETREILYGIRPRLEQAYGVTITEEAVETALSLSPRYMRSLRLPDKVISWLNSSCVKVEIRRPHDRQVRSSDVVEVISEHSGIPRDMVFRDTSDRFRDIEQALARRVVGQRHAIAAVARQIRMNKGPLKENHRRPDGVLLFLGPTGVGKTELAKALAEFLFGDEHRMVRLDMSEYRDITGVDKLIGMPRGIVGSERGGILTNQLRDHPYTVVLLDEMEKADPYVLNLFLQVFDEGWLTDGRGRKVYFSDAVIIMTSNLGSHEFQRLTRPLGFLSDRAAFEDAKRAVMEEVERTFSPEFLNRIDEIVVFSPLTFEEVREIARMYLERINEQMHQWGKSVEVTEEALDLMVREGYSPKYGARFLKRRIDELVKVPLTLRWREADRFLVEACDGRLEVRPCPSSGS